MTLCCQSWPAPSRRASSLCSAARPPAATEPPIARGGAPASAARPPAAAEPRRRARAGRRDRGARSRRAGPCRAPRACAAREAAQGLLAWRASGRGVLQGRWPAIRRAGHRRPNKLARCLGPSFVPNTGWRLRSRGSSLRGRAPQQGAAQLAPAAQPRRRRAAPARPPGCSPPLARFLLQCYKGTCAACRSANGTIGHPASSHSATPRAAAA